MKQARLTDGDWTASTAESHSAPTQSDENETSDERYPTTKAALCERAAAHAEVVVGEHFPELPVETIDWDTSTRMQRSAGVAIYNQQNEQITIRLSWDAYEAYGWEQFSRVVRHELIHAWQYHEYGEADHGSTFKQWVEPLETDRHCEQYTEPKYWVVCEECESRDPRYRRSKVVKEPEKYSCGRCGGSILINSAYDRSIPDTSHSIIVHISKNITYIIALFFNILNKFGISSVIWVYGDIITYIGIFIRSCDRSSKCNL